MRTTRLATTSLLLTSAFLSPTLIFTGCQSTKEIAGQKAAMSARDFQSALSLMPGQIDKVTSSLQSLQLMETTDKAGTFTTFTKELRTLESQAMSLANTRDFAQENSQRYFREWLKESRKHKKTADRDAALAAFDAGKSQATAAQGYLDRGSREFRALIDQLNQTQTKLATDLSPATLQKMNLAPIFDKAIATKANIARLSEEIDAALGLK